MKYVVNHIEVFFVPSFFQCWPVYGVEQGQMAGAKSVASNISGTTVLNQFNFIGIVIHPRQLRMIFRSASAASY